MKNGEVEVEPPAKGECDPAPDFHTLVKEYLTWCATEGRRRKTVSKYRSNLQCFANFAANHSIVHVADLDQRFFDRFRNHRKPLIDATSMYHEGVAIRLFLNWCCQRSLIENNFLADTKFRRPRKEPKGGPNLAEINRILAASNEQWEDIASVLTFTGMRSGDCSRLRPQDLDLKGNWLHIISDEGRETKSGLSRKVPIHPRLRPTLERLPRHKRPWLFTAPPSNRYPAGDHHINTKRLNEYLVALLKKLNIRSGREDGYTTHSLRHSFETICVNAGIPQRVIDTWLGHASDRSMASVYYRLSDEDSQRFMLQVPFGTGKPAADAGDNKENGNDS